jgi:hypothetical protein
MGFYSTEEGKFTFNHDQNYSYSQVNKLAMNEKKIYYMKNTKIQ